MPDDAAPRSLERLSKDIPWGMDGYQYRWIDEQLAYLRAIDARVAALEARSDALLLALPGLEARIAAIEP